MKYFIIGSFDEDKKNPLKRPGPLLLAWALSDLLAGKASVAREPLNSPLALLGLAGFAALLAIGVFEYSFRVARGRIAPSHWYALARWIGLAAFLIAALLLLCVGSIVLLANRVIPVTFPIFSAALGATFVWLNTKQWIADEQVRGDLGGTGEERAVQYDVFISYAHEPAENTAWVKRTIVDPLKALRRADGTGYKVFFDDTAIRVGRQWKSEIELALMGTRCFLPVYSDLYFKRPYCREEIEIADQLRIEGRLRMFPIARTVDHVPERYLRKLQYVDARARPDFINDLISQIEDSGVLPSLPKLSEQKHLSPR